MRLLKGETEHRMIVRGRARGLFMGWSRSNLPKKVGSRDVDVGMVGMKSFQDGRSK